jgi:diguanylate cyclase (GGDEF)-like protein
MLSFFSKSQKAEPVRSEPAEPPPQDPGAAAMSRETGLVLDALCSVLQLYGKHAFDTDLKTGDELRRLMQGWKMHASMGAPRPDHTDDKPTAGVFYRDWKGLVRFFGERRRDETKYVTTVLDDFRDVTWAFVNAVHHVVVEERDESRIATDQLSRLRVAVESSSTDLMRREALKVVGVMESLIEHRRERQKQQFAVLADKLKRLGRELEEAHRESGTDSLTGLANRKSFDDVITRSIELHSLLGQPACLMMIDVDRFKQINDGFGHPAGDAILKQVANALSRTFLRRVDFVCRYGGDEFAVILQETSAESAGMLAERLRSNVRELPPIDLVSTVEPPKVAISVGLGELGDADNAASWIKRADTALYNAKRAGRDQVATLDAE